jgi:hypothetical protein
MSLQANINVPGLITLNYPYQGQSITSHVRLAGNVIIPDKDSLPAGTDYLMEQLSPGDQLLVLPSHALYGKTYNIKDITYYMDGVAVRQVDYTEDEIRTYRFNDDYLSVFYGDEISEGNHVYTIVVTAYSSQNPGIIIYDSLELNFVYDLASNSIKTMLDAITPQPFLGADDHQTIMYALDYVLTKRTEGSLKTDIDFLGSLYDLDKIPDYLIPFLAKTIGYDYFAGLLGNGDSIREELRFLPDWQKSVGTKESILVLLRALAISGNIVPLYLDLQNKTLVTGAKQRYLQTDSTSFPAQTKQARWTIPLVQQNFVTTSINHKITDVDGNVLASFVWDIVLNQAVWQTFAAGWIKRPDGTNADLTDVESVYADNNRGGITISFTSALKIVATTKFVTTYQYEVETKPSRNTRLSEFFDLVLSSLEKPNESKTKDYQHAMEIVKRSKPLRTKLRNITFPVKMADAFVSNAGSVSSTNTFSNPDRISDQNIKVTEVNMLGIRDSVGLSHKGLFADGFLFSWEIDCNLFENRFGIYHSLALDPALFGPNFREILARDTLVQRGHAIMVLDDELLEENKKSLLRRVDFQMRNFTTEPACTLTTDYLGHYHTIKNSIPTTPASVTFSDLLIELDVPSISPAGSVTLIIEDPTAGANRTGRTYTWDGDSGLVQGILETGVTGSFSFTIDTANLKTIEDSYSGLDYTITLVRCPTAADVEDLYLSRPNLRNIQIDLNKWYAIYDITGDFYADPVHLSVFFSAVYLNHQGTCCNCDLDIVTTSTPATFNQILGKTYQFGYEFDLEIYAISTNEIVGVYHWNSRQWIPVLVDSDFTVTLSPVNGGVWTDDLTVAGTITYVGAAPAGIAQEWGIRACPRKVGDRLGIDLNAQYTDDFGLAMVHGGMLGVIDESQSFLDLKWGDLIPHQHDQGDQHLAAFDGYYLRGGVLLPAFSYHVTMAGAGVFQWDSSPAWDNGFAWDFATQFQWDVDFFDAIQKVWDGSNPIATEFFIHHFPKRQVYEFA